MDKATPFDALVAALGRAHEVLTHESDKSSPEERKAMLRRCKDPRKKGVKLTSRGNGFLTEGNRWFVEEFSGSDGECYERAERQWGLPIVKWFIITLL